MDVALKIEDVRAPKITTPNEVIVKVGVAGKAKAANWASEVEHLAPETMVALIQMAGDIYLHNRKRRLGGTGILA